MTRESTPAPPHTSTPTPVAWEPPAWLPARLLQASFKDAVTLEIVAYDIFRKDWDIFPIFRGDEVRIHRRPHKANATRWHTYWHCVTEGEPEETRTKPMIDRLERIPWSRPLIEYETDTAAGIKVWANIRGRDRHVCIWFEPENYLIILKIAATHFVLKTTYCPESRRRIQLQRDYSAWKKTGRVF